MLSKAPCSCISWCLPLVEMSFGGLCCPLGPGDVGLLPAGTLQGAPCSIFAERALALLPPAFCCPPHSRGFPTVEVPTITACCSPPSLHRHIFCPLSQHVASHYWSSRLPPIQIKCELARDRGHLESATSPVKYDPQSWLPSPFFVRKGRRGNAARATPACSERECNPGSQPMSPS